MKATQLALFPITDATATGPNPARREPLTELDALTDQIAPLLTRLDATWRRVENSLRQ